jgi:2-polyprenyl-3-methyl-5-hydroxy-6-metoxy-1,4-benzoquinol methylase
MSNGERFCFNALQSVSNDLMDMESVNQVSETQPGKSQVEQPTPEFSPRTRPSAKIDRRVLERTQELLKHRQSITVLEAGCGAASHFRYIGNMELHGIDVSQEELDKNRDVQSKMLGDIQTYPLTPAHYDVVVCWDVIEHLSRPQDALSNMFRSVKPGGLILLGFPNLMSFKGLVTKATPWGFHRFVYRFLGLKSKPFKTYLRREILPQRVLQLATANGFFPEHFELEKGAIQQRICKRIPPVGALFSLIDFLVRAVSLGRGPSLWLDYCTMILRKREAAAP